MKNNVVSIIKHNNSKLKYFYVLWILICIVLRNYDWSHLFYFYFLYNIFSDELPTQRALLAMLRRPWSSRTRSQSSLLLLAVSLIPLSFSFLLFFKVHPFQYLVTCYIQDALIKKITMHHFIYNYSIRTQNGFLQKDS